MLRPRFRLLGPSDEEKQAANTCMKHAYDRLELTFKHIPGTAVA
jgi:hypothetical protein